MSSRSPKPAAQKRPRAAAPLDEAARALRRVLGGDDRSPTEEIPLVPVRGTGVERPVPEWVDVSQRLYRTFAFVDISGFTAYTDRHGSDAAIELLNRFRSACRDVTGRRGVRVAKWLGDGVMLVGTEPGPAAAAVAELLLRLNDDDFEIHAGIAAGTVLLFEGDDYVGRPVNLAARLCEAAGPGEALCVGLDGDLPEWVSITGSVTVRATGIGDITDVAQISVDDEAWATAVAPSAHHPSVPEGVEFAELGDHEGAEPQVPDDDPEELAFFDVANDA
ncbi:MAG TPA: adenylate/guanylate cyclase domain-containing protein [Microthrixaceae bacterium]|nr:adenylate/guanylate cyclase domain-containing protein [Microthrixaceae bacterium]